MLFFATIVIVAVIAITLLRWIQHLSSFGRVRDTIERVETIARRAMQAWAEAPHLGAQPPVAVPSETSPVYPAETGYVAHIDVAGLARIADKHTLTIHIAELPGAFVFTERALAHVAGAIDDQVRAAIEKTFSILTDREFEQDPRFGLIVLSEIASRALSPAVNDPGTAIRVLGAGQRVLSDLVDTKRGAEAAHLRVHAPALEVDDMFDDFFRPIARDGASIIEVQLRLIATLNGLATHAPDVFGETARRHADAAKLRAAEALAFDGDRQAMRMSGR